MIHLEQKSVTSYESESVFSTSESISSQLSVTDILRALDASIALNIAREELEPLLTNTSQILDGSTSGEGLASLLQTSSSNINKESGKSNRKSGSGLRLQYTQKSEGLTLSFYGG